MARKDLSDVQPVAIGAFSAYLSASTAIAQNAAIVFNAEMFDTFNWYDTSNGRFTPQLPGIYHIGGSIIDTGSISSYAILAFAKGGTQGGELGAAVGGGILNVRISGSVLVEANGTTDYFTLQYSSGGAAGSHTLTGAAGLYTHFWGRYVGART